MICLCGRRHHPTKRGDYWKIGQSTKGRLLLQCDDKINGSTRIVLNSQEAKQMADELKLFADRLEEES